MQSYYNLTYLQLSRNIPYLPLLPSMMTSLGLLVWMLFHCGLWKFTPGHGCFNFAFFFVGNYQVKVDRRRCLVGHRHKPRGRFVKCLSNLYTQQNTAQVFCRLNTPISVFTFCYSAVDYIYDCVIDSFQYFRVLLTLKLISNGASI